MQSAPADAALRDRDRDRDIVELLHSGAREQAFELLLARYEHKVYRLCCGLLRNTTRAQDAAQESLVRIWKALASYDGRASLSTWIYTITRNRCLTALERQRDLDALSGESDVELELAGAVDAAPDDQSTLLRELVGLLPERYRRTLTLYYFEERSVGEVAAMLAVPEGTIKTLLHRARAALMEQLRRRGLASPSLWLETST
jgi:RNA polymerase sigma-70 factor (ECF subfamily)